LSNEFLLTKVEIHFLRENRKSDEMKNQE